MFKNCIFDVQSIVGICALYTQYCSKVLGQYDFFKEINTFIQKGYIKLIKSDSKDIYYVSV